MLALRNVNNITIPPTIPYIPKSDSPNVFSTMRDVYKDTIVDISILKYNAKELLIILLLSVRGVSLSFTFEKDIRF